MHIPAETKPSQPEANGAEGGISKLQALIRRRQSGRFNEVNAVLPLSRRTHSVVDGVGGDVEDGPPGLLYVTNLPGATAAFTATPPFVAALSPAQQLLRRRNVRCIVSLLSPNGAVPHSARGEIGDMEAAAAAYPSLRPYLGGTECPDFSASTAVATAAGRVRPYPVYISIPIIPSSNNGGGGSPAPRSAALALIESTLHAACEMVAFHEGRLLGRLEASAATPTPDQQLMVPVYHLHVAVEDNHTTRLSSFLPTLLPLLHMYMHEGGTEKDFEFALAAGEKLLTQLGYADGGATLNVSPLLSSTSAPSPSPSSWAAKASSQPVTPYHAPAFSNPPSLLNTPSFRAAHDSTTSLPPTLASLVSRAPSQRRTTEGTWVAAHTLLHQTQHRLRTLLGEVVVAPVAGNGVGAAGVRRPSSWAAMATGGSSVLPPSYPCSVLVHCLQGISRSGSVAVAYSMLYARACKVLPTEVVLVGDGGDLLPHQRAFFAALEAVQRGRPFVDPNAAFRSELMQISQIWTDATTTSP